MVHPGFNKLKVSICMTLLDQVAQTLFDVPDRAARGVFGSAVFLSSDIGLVRDENQDRVVTFRVSHPSNGGSTTVVALSDGMGGMASGAECATLTLASFIDHIAASSEQDDLDRLLTDAAHFANEQVHGAFAGRGGATLSAVAWNARREIRTLNVGDSRIFELTSMARDGFARLTTDDTMREAFGSEGNGLIQFIGLGRGLRPHLKVPTGRGSLILTSDGVHFVDESVFADILTHANSPRAKTERLSALARWMGGPDNATIAVIDLEQVPSRNEATARATLEVWPCGAESLNLWSLPEQKATPPPVPPAAKDPEPLSHLDSKASAAPASRRRSKKRAKRAAPEQLQIEIEVDEGDDANSKPV
jgi:serine/threonine protein phosphatase PrpC